MFKRDIEKYQATITVLGTNTRDSLKLLKDSLKKTRLRRYKIILREKSKYHTSFLIETTSLSNLKELSAISNKNIFLIDYSILA